MNTGKSYIVIVLLSMLPLLHMFLTQDLPHTSDGGVHLPRMAAYFKSLKDLHVPVRWAGDINYGYGLPLFNFIYHMPYMISSGLLLLGFPLILAFKLVLATSFLLSGIFMFAFANEFFKDTTKALLVTIFYQFSPYRLVDLLVRGNAGGIYTYAFFPLILFGLTRILQKNQTSYRNLIITSFATYALVVSHNSLSLIFFIAAVAFVLIYHAQTKQKFACFMALLVGLALSAYFWIPAIGEHKYTYGNLFMRDLFRTHFPPFLNFFIPNFTDNENLRIAEVSVQFGLFHTIAIVVGILGLGTHIDRQTKNITLFSLCIVVLSLFFMQPVSLILWEHMAFLRQFQFPWRFLSLVTLATSLLSVHFLAFPYFKKRFVLSIFIFLTIISTVYYWKPTQGYEKVDQHNFWNFPLTTTYFGETDVIWSAGPANDYPPSRVEIISGKGMVQDFVKRTSVHTFFVKSETPITVVDHTIYFPGWRAFIDSKIVPIQFQDPNWRGLITFQIPQGTHTIRVEFGESKIRIIADLISLITLFSLLSLQFYNLLKNRVRS